MKARYNQLALIGQFQKKVYGIAFIWRMSLVLLICLKHTGRLNNGYQASLNEAAVSLKRVRKQRGVREDNLYHHRLSCFVRARHRHFVLHELTD
jgi:hypothetical protein